MSQQSVTVYAPASMANISVGFDILGAAVSPISGQLLGDCVTVEAAPTFALHVTGQFVDKLPANPKLNIVYQCWQRFCQALGQPVNVTITLQKNMPIGSGLGSSACSVAGALVALNEFCQRPFDRQQLLLMMGELEGQISGSIHYDNVAPCYLGGMQLIIDQAGIVSQPLPIFDEWYWVLAYPGITVSTAQARSILPEQYSRKDCVAHGRHTAGFVHACYSGQAALAAAMLHDVVAEPYRQQLLPGFKQARQALADLGALASGISGSGPTLFSLYDNLAIAEQAANYLQQHYVQNQQGFVHICKIDQHGTRRLEPTN